MFCKRHENKSVQDVTRDFHISFIFLKIEDIGALRWALADKNVCGDKIIVIFDIIFRLPFICCGPSHDEVGKSTNLGSSPTSEVCLISSDKSPSRILEKNSRLSHVSSSPTSTIDSVESSMIPHSVG